MNERDAVWSKMLLQAIEKANADGRSDVADYLRLKAANDAIRQASIGWIFDTLVEIAGDANRSNSRISIEREDPYRFTYRGSNMAGSLLRLQQGVRCLTLEAGWTRTPSDGFMRGGALAVARITHLGMSKANVELFLQKRGELPVWSTMKDEKPGNIVRTETLREHFLIFTGDRL